MGDECADVPKDAIPDDDLRKATNVGSQCILTQIHQLVTENK